MLRRRSPEVLTIHDFTYTSGYYSLGGMSCHKEELPEALQEAFNKGYRKVVLLSDADLSLWSKDFEADEFGNWKQL